MRRFKHKKTKAHERLRYHALLLVTDGYLFQQTAAVLFVDPESVSRWVAIYERMGSGWTVRAIIQLVEERFNYSYSQPGIGKLLRTLDFSCQRGRPFYNRRTVDDQRRFESETLEVLEEFAASR
jgi:transposase